MAEPWRETLVYSFTCVHGILTLTSSDDARSSVGYQEKISVQYNRSIFTLHFKMFPIDMTWIPPSCNHKKVFDFISNGLKKRSFSAHLSFTIMAVLLYSWRHISEWNWILKLSCIQYCPFIIHEVWVSIITHDALKSVNFTISLVNSTVYSEKRCHF